MAAQLDAERVIYATLNEPTPRSAELGLRYISPEKQGTTWKPLILSQRLRPWTL